MVDVLADQGVGLHCVVLVHLYTKQCIYYQEKLSRERERETGTERQRLRETERQKERERERKRDVSFHSFVSGTLDTRLDRLLDGT